MIIEKGTGYHCFICHKYIDAYEEGFGDHMKKHREKGENQTTSCNKECAQFNILVP